MVRLFVAFLCSLATLLLQPGLLRAQQACAAPPIAKGSLEDNIFHGDRENDLGDAIAESVRLRFRVSDDREVVGYVQRLGDHLLRYVGPGGDLKLKYFLVESPTPDAFAIPGRIYVSRKLVSFVESEEELAGSYRDWPPRDSSSSPSRISRFGQFGTRLVVVTDDQTA